MSDFLLAVFVSLLLVSIFFKKNLKLSNISNFKKNFLFYLLILILFILWFLKFPSLRYGGYILVISTLVIPFSFLFKFENLDNRKLKKNFLILFSISICFKKYY